eukprot:TRINITY_DN32883_c0_g1_i1.p1 TRINITY_DN32883_c0_g1~~TRINITY_DN32883_c0_g1_i1.p1  ORF type:complete len:365 (-),score=22.60 TRINITY_DN32883_c0_g1_i1:140-1234(-)
MAVGYATRSVRLAKSMIRRAVLLCVAPMVIAIVPWANGNTCLPPAAIGTRACSTRSAMSVTDTPGPNEEDDSAELLHMSLLQQRLRNAPHVNSCKPPPVHCRNESCPTDEGKTLIRKCTWKSFGRYSGKLCRPERLQSRSPDYFEAAFDTSEGPVVIAVNRSWAPKSADRFYGLFLRGYYDRAKFYRAISGFVVQFGPNGHPSLAKVYANNNCMDAAVSPCAVPGACFYVDEVKQSNLRGFVSFSCDVKESVCSCPCTSAPEICKSAHADDALIAGSELFINLVNNTRLDPLGFAPFGQVISGMRAVDRIYTGYDELRCMSSGCSEGHSCMGPDFHNIYTKGNAYLNWQFPCLSSIKRTRLKAE